jgi:hypothetical protein
VTSQEKSYLSLLQSLKAGTFWAGHGRVLNNFQLTAEIDDVQTLAYPGSTVHGLALGDIISLNVNVERSELYPDAPLEVEFISNCPNGEATLFNQVFIGPKKNIANIFLSLTATGTDQRSCYVRSRVRYRNNPDFMAYSNHIRFNIN